MTSWTKLNLEKIFSKYEPIEQQKHRPSIFKQKKFKFQQIYNPILPEIDIFQSSCPCENTLTQCQRLKSMIKQANIQKAEQIYQYLKAQKVKKILKTIQRRQSFQINNVLKAHFYNLQIVLNIKQAQPLLQILRHSKSQYLTFWVYGLFCSNWPNRQNYFANVDYLIKKCNLDLSFQLSHYENNFSDQKDAFISSYTKKLANLYKNSNEYITILRLICQGKVQMIVQKLTVCMLMKGRVRSQKQAINAALQL